MRGRKIISYEKDARLVVVEAIPLTTAVSSRTKLRAQNLDDKTFFDWGKIQKLTYFRMLVSIS